MTTTTKPPNQNQIWAFERYRRILGMKERGAGIQDIMRAEGVKRAMAYHLLKQAYLYQARGWL